MAQSALHGAPVVVMTAGGLPAALVVQALSRRFANLHVIVEAPEGKGEILRRRARRLGLAEAAGQLATMAVAKVLRRICARRVSQIVARSGQGTDMPDTATLHPVASVNSDAAIATLRSIAPAAVLLVSTRLLSRTTLERITCPVLNLHAGINPAYRGQMGGYWSLAKGDAANFGATVHLVDAGTDTGATLYECRTAPRKGDNISTYPLLLTAAALPVTVQAMEDAVMGTLGPRPPEGPSALRFPPAIWTWIWTGLTRGIW